MTNVLIYGGLGIMLLGAVFGFFVAVKGYRATDWSKVKRMQVNLFHQGSTTPRMKRLILAWGIIMIIGLIITGIGIATGI